MFDLSFTTQYKRDLKLARKRGLDEDLLDETIMLLINGKPLPAKNKDHSLQDNYKGCRECHIAPALSHSVVTQVYDYNSKGA